MQILNALDLKKGKKVASQPITTLTRPLQFLPATEKNESWARQNLDWLEWQGIQQVRYQVKRYQKNYNLAEGLIDRSDYIVDQNNEYSELVKILTRDSDSPLELKFYPIVPNVIRILLGEFAKRTSKIMFRTVDDISYNEQLEEKRMMIEAVLLKNAYLKQQQKLAALSGQQIQQTEDPDPEKLKTLPEIEHFFRKDYQSLQERWANFQYKVDEERFSMPELELSAFRDMLVTNSEFWHFRMMKNDFELELWDPRFTFFSKAPGSRYISTGNYVGKIELLTIAEVIDLYGYLMSEEQLRRLESVHPIYSARYNLPGVQNDGAFYDPTKSKAWNTNFPSLAMRQWQSSDHNRSYTTDIDEVLRSSSDPFEMNDDQLIRVTTSYWKSQRKVGHLTKISLTGEVIQTIITEDYKITDQPHYNTVFQKEKTKDNLIFGEHIDWIWINDVYGGIKIGSNRSAWINTDDNAFEPVYLGIDSAKPARLRFQFKGDSSLYGCKLPVEGRIFSERSTRSTGLVDLMKPFQIQYNLVNNQIADILVDELGTVVVLDQNALPRHSLGEDWGRGNLSKAYVAMKNFQMLALDTTITNTENPLNFNHWQVLNLEQTNRLLGRVNLSNHFKEQAFEVIGINSQRRGQEMGRQTAKGVEENLNASYAQTELYFIQHCDQLMPRVHAMRTDLAQFYHSRQPSVRLQHMTSLDEKINFELFGSDLLMRDFNVYCTTKTNQRMLLDQLKNLAVNNNTTGASIYDLGNIIKSDSTAELDEALKAVEQKMLNQRQQEMAHQQQLEAQQQESEQILMREQQDREDKREAARNQKDILVAEIRAAGYAGMKDFNNNQQSDYLDALEQIRRQQEYQDSINLKKDQEINKKQLARDQMALKREELLSRERVADKQLQVAKENKNKYDVKSKR